MVTSMTGETTIRPRRYSLWYCALVAAVLVVPIFVTLYWLAIPLGLTLAVTIGLAAVLVLGLVAALRYLAVRTVISERTVTVTPFWGRRRSFDIDAVMRTIVLQLKRDGGSRPFTQLFAMGRDGLLLRMHGEFWSDDAIDLFAARMVTAPVQHLEDPLTLEDVQLTNASALAWYERRPLTAALSRRRQRAASTQAPG